MREKFGRWIKRPPVSSIAKPAPPTFVWVIERPLGGQHVDCHWLLHVPAARQKDFERKLPAWLSSVAGDIINETAAIHVQDAYAPRGAGKYMLKGMHPSWAAHYDIDFEPQAEIYCRRSGFTKNIGPTQKRRLIATGKHPKPQTWVSYRRAQSKPLGTVNARIS